MTIAVDLGRKAAKQTKQNHVYTDHLDSQRSVDLDLHCFQNKRYVGYHSKGLNNNK